MTRTVQPEILDSLRPTDSQAIRSRRDLIRVNALMGNHSILARVLQRIINPPRSVTELGAGDGQFLLRLARRLGPRWRGTKGTILDQCDAVNAATLAEFADLSWEARTIVGDVRRWIHSTDAASDVMFANLFLHHFSEHELSELLVGIASRSRTFVAVEPRRSAWSLFFSRSLWMIGCNKVTCYDAPVSVKAGFSGSEISALWPQMNGWELMETKAGFFGHLFVAQRKD